MATQAQIIANRFFEAVARINEDPLGGKRGKTGEIGGKRGKSGDFRIKSG